MIDSSPQLKNKPHTYIVTNKHIDDYSELDDAVDNARKKRRNEQISYFDVYREIHSNSKLQPGSLAVTLSVSESNSQSPSESHEETSNIQDNIQKETIYKIPKDIEVFQTNKDLSLLPQSSEAENIDIEDLEDNPTVTQGDTKNDLIPTDEKLFVDNSEQKANPVIQRKIRDMTEGLFKE